MSSSNRDLIQATQLGEAGDIRKHLKDGADPNAKDETRSTALHYAVKRENTEVVKLLLESGADRNAQDDSGSTALHHAASAGHTEIMSILLNKASPRSKPEFPITINGNKLDESIPPAVDASKTNYILVQSRKRLNALQRQDLVVAGLELLDYVCKNTYLYGYKGIDLDRIRQMEPIVYVDVYRQELKISQGLDKTMNYKVDIVFHEDVDWKSTTFQRLIAKESEVEVDQITFFPRKARLEIQDNCLDRVASLDQVRRIEEVGKVVLRNEQARGILGVDTVQLGVQGQQYKGAGQVIAIADTGFDNGQPNHPLFGARVLRLYDIGGLADQDGHGTHVCGSAVADGQGTNAHLTGTAPQANLVVQCLGPGLGWLPDDLAQLFGPPYTDYDVRVHSDSWGHEYQGAQRGYDASANEIDTFVWKHKDMLICWAAGNDAAGNDVAGLGNRHIGAEAAAKNCITVGASENRRPNDTETYGNLAPGRFGLPISARRVAQNPGRVAAFSSRGPTMENRIKPDVVAPGTRILSANLSSGQELGCYMSGTSMATPLVAGCAAVLREALIKNKTKDPSAALIKALLINGAEILPNQTPDVQGFGRVNLKNSLAVATTGGEVAAFYQGSFDQSDEKPFCMEINVNASSTTLKVTLVWSDPPGPMIRNSLLLKVQHDNGEERHDYDAADYDNLNNVQQVLWQDMPVGRTTLTVELYDLQESLQPFAVVWSQL